MCITDKDEYVTLRQEMLERFQRIHDTMKWGIGGFIAFISFYFSTSKVDIILPNGVPLLIMQSIVTFIGLSVLVNYYGIYTEGTYIKIKLENSGERWHNMSRNFGKYMKNIYKPKAGEKVSLRYKLGFLWGSDSAILSIIILCLALSSFGIILINEGCFNAIIWSDIYQIPIFLIAYILFVINIILWYKLFLGMQKFKENTENRWNEYYKYVQSENKKD